MGRSLPPDDPAAREVFGFRGRGTTLDFLSWDECREMANAGMTFGAHTRLCRAYVPGLHREIPVSVSVAGQEPRPYQPPTPVRDLLMTSAQEERHA